MSGGGAPGSCPKGPALRPSSGAYLSAKPWLFGVPVDGEREFFAGTGLELREFFVIGGEESLKRYATKADGTQVGAEAIAAAMERFRQLVAASGDASQSALMSPERMRESQRLMSYQLAEAVVPAR